MIEFKHRVVPAANVMVCLGHWYREGWRLIAVVPIGPERELYLEREQPQPMPQGTIAERAAAQVERSRFVPEPIDPPPGDPGRSRFVPEGYPRICTRAHLCATAGHGSCNGYPRSVRGT